MTTVELINSLTWPAAFAIVGSIVTIVGGFVGFLLKLRTPEPVANTDENQSKMQVLQDRISEGKDIAQNNKNEVGVIKTKVESIQKQLDEHEARDQRDFATASRKIDKLTDIVMKILQDEKL